VHPEIRDRAGPACRWARSAASSTCTTGPSCAIRFTEHGEIRYAQGYSAPVRVDESRVLQVATFSTLDLHQIELDHNQMLLDAMVIADEVDMQLAEILRSLISAKAAKDAA